ncbi:hypothetical protein JYG23_00790 [Sedimentibacter sp. zth1]|uniref:CD1247 N-terminal domain-containing protein n=1 Tax=Sedimentibacter sp. zth1 TaxID=2816908 RepID=UPI001A930CD5|nr:CD1247 N-terminal domain-containing protein [Sedimentibacter sp. zth1]QSX06036.1 hypothetical protein JYG23_00790 [Sedimentibacter sp. zth1]
MDFLFEKIAYLKGLAEGLDVSENTKEGKLFKAMIDVLEEITNNIDELVEDQDEVNEYLDLLDEDLSKVEGEIFGEYDIDEDFEFDEDDFEDECECSCGCDCE